MLYQIQTVSDEVSDLRALVAKDDVPIVAPRPKRVRVVQQVLECFIMVLVRRTVAKKCSWTPPNGTLWVAVFPDFSFEKL